MESIIMYHVVSVIQMVVFTIYLKEILGLKRHALWMIGCWGGLEIVNQFVINITTSVAVNGIVYVALLEAIAFVMCKGTLKRKLFLIFVYYGMNALIETILIGILIYLKSYSLDMITSNEMISNFLLILSQIFLFLVVLSVKYLGKQKLFYEVDIKNWFGCFSISAGCFCSIFLLAIYMIENDSFDMMLVVVVFVLACINFLSYYFYFVSAEKQQMKLEARDYQKQIQIYQIWYEGIQQNRKEIRAVRHDMKNHFMALRRLCENDKNEYEAEERLHRIGDYLEQIGVTITNDVYGVDSGNLMLDAIVDLKKNYALLKEIVMDTEIFVPKNMNYNHVDMVVILGNILDNAIEACEKIEEVKRKIYLKIEYKQENLMIKIQNSYDGNMDGQSGELTENVTWKTTKEDRHLHGIGMKNVVEVVKKYEGVVDWKADNGMFQVDIFLYEFQN